MRSLTALPVFNEVQHVAEVVREVRQNSGDVLVVDDGSTDGTAELLDTLEHESCQCQRLLVVRHARNRGYGAALRSAFEFACEHDYDVLTTVDCDGQHEPCRIPSFVAACDQADIVSGSRYLEPPPVGSAPPADRRRVNRKVTAELNRRLGAQLTDAFCGFKSYRVPVLRSLNLTEDGYAMPLELWVQAAFAGLTILERPVPLIYLDASRSFGDALDDEQARLAYYWDVLDRAMAKAVTRLDPSAPPPPFVADAPLADPCLSTSQPSTSPERERDDQDFGECSG